MVANPSGSLMAALKVRRIPVAKSFVESRPGPRVVTINSWNEWTEGSYLEPDTVYGTAFLDAIKSVFRTGR